MIWHSYYYHRLKSGKYAVRRSDDPEEKYVVNSKEAFRHLKRVEGIEVQLIHKPQLGRKLS